MALPRIQANVLSRADSQAKIVDLPSGRTSSQDLWQSTHGCGHLSLWQFQSGLAGSLQHHLRQEKMNVNTHQLGTLPHVTAREQSVALRQAHQVAVRPKKVVNLGFGSLTFMTHFCGWLGVKPHVVPESHITCPWLQSFFNMPQPIYKLRSIFQACRWVHHKGQVCYWNSSPSANNSTKIQVWLSFSFLLFHGKKSKTHGSLHLDIQPAKAGLQTTQRSVPSKVDHAMDSSVRVDRQWYLQVDRQKHQMLGPWNSEQQL